MADEPAYVFVSFSREDLPRVEVIVAALHGRGIPVRFDQDVLPGERWDERLEEWLDGAAAVLVLWSAASALSPNVVSEATSAGRRLVPVVLDGFDNIAPPFRRIQALDLTDWKDDASDSRLDALAELLRGRLTGVPGSTELSRTEDLPIEDATTADDAAISGAVQVVVPPAPTTGTASPEAEPGEVGGDSDTPSAGEATGAVPSGHTPRARPIGPSDGARAILGVASKVRDQRAPHDTIRPIDVLLGAFARAERAGSAGSAGALYRSLRAPRAPRLARAAAVLGIEALVGEAPPTDLIPESASHIMASASRCEQLTTGSGSVRSRHLMAAAVIGALDPAVLEVLGRTQSGLVATFQEYLRGYWPAESEGWNHILGSVLVRDTPRGSDIASEEDSAAPARTPDMAEDARLLLRLAVSVAASDAGEGEIDATAVVVGALCDGGGRPSIRLASDMLTWLVEHLPVAATRGSLGDLVAMLLAASGRPAVRMAGPPNLAASFTAALLVRARQMAERTSGGPEIGARHLLGAAIAELPPAGEIVGALGGTPAVIRASLRDAVMTSSDDSLEAWDTILFGPNQDLGGGYTRDVGWPDEGERDDTVDTLGRQGEADMFAALITDHDMNPPLAIGLFGSWGSGKSFFMKMIHRAVKANVPDGSYAQVRFNAWHYSDSSLWASLADELFEQLASHVQGDEDDPATTVRRSHALESEVRRNVEARRAQVVAARDRLRGELRDAATIREQALREGSAAYVKRLAVVIDKAPEARADLEVITGALGIKDPVAAYRALAGDARYLRDETATLSRDARNRLRWSLLAVAAALTLVAALVILLPNADRALMFTAIATVGAGLAQAGRVVASAGTVTAAARRFYSRASALDEEVRSTPTEEEERLAAELRDADVAEAAAQAQLTDVEARIATLETELAELSGERRLYRFLTDRAASTDYKGQLGTISIIRKDLATLVQRLQGLENGRGLRRIVLYIDDLDRCAPAQVVAVLQAVNLLLSTPLFVVVLGVDPTWLERSLRHEYRGVVAGATPREYLEKIFQIPYVLPPMADGFSSFVRSIVGSMATDGRASTSASSAPTAAHTGQDGVVGGETPVVPTTSVEEATPITVEVGSAAALVGDAEAAAAPTALTGPELDMLAALGSLVPTPRAATRVVNLYRLVRTTRYVGRSSRFLGTDGSPADFMVVIQLLAVAARSPDVLAELSARLRNEGAGVRTWNDLLSKPGPGRILPDWDGTVASLQALSANFPVPSDLQPYRTWVSRLSRFTFTLSAVSPSENHDPTGTSSAESAS